MKQGIKPSWPDIVFKPAKKKGISHSFLGPLAKKKKIQSDLIDDLRKEIESEKKARAIRIAAIGQTIQNPGDRLKLAKDKNGNPVLRRQAFNPATRKAGKFLPSLPL